MVGDKSMCSAGCWVGGGVWGVQFTILTINKWSRAVSGVSVIINSIVSPLSHCDQEDGCSWLMLSEEVITQS